MLIIKPLKVLRYNRIVLGNLAQSSALPTPPGTIEYG